MGPEHTPSAAAPAPKTAPAQAGAAAPSTAAGAVLGLQRGAGNAAVARMLARAPTKDVPLAGVKVNHQRVNVPVPPGTTVKASASPANATGVTYGVEKGTVDPSATTVDPTTGDVTIGDAQPGGELKVTGETATVKADFPMHPVEKPTTLASTTASPGGGAGSYGGDFTHTFTGKGQASALEGGRIDEKFDTLTPKNPFGSFTLNANKAGGKGWGLDSGGTMNAPDHVTVERKLIDVRPFVKSASNPAPKQTLPVGFTMAQHLHVKLQPGGALDAAPFTDADHIRRLEERNGTVVFVVKAGKDEVVQDYTGPPAFHNATASPATIVASAPRPPAPKKGKAPPWQRNEVTVTADTIPAGAPIAFSIVETGPARLDCEIDGKTGVVKIGAKPGTITVRAGTKAHYDEVHITITAPPPPPPAAAPGTPAKTSELEGAPEDEQVASLETGTGAGGLLARQPAPAPPVAGPGELTELVRSKQYDRALGALRPMPETTAVEALAVLTWNDLVALNTAGSHDPDPGRVARVVMAAEKRRVELLRKRWLDAVDKDWDEAARILNAFVDNDVDEMIKAFTPDQLKQLEAGALRGMPGFAQRLVDRVRKKSGRKAGEAFGKVVSERYDARPLLRPHVPTWMVKLELRFDPDPAVAKASKIGFIQTVRLKPAAGGKDPIAGHAERATPGGTTIDRPGVPSGPDKDKPMKSPIYGQKDDGTLDNTGRPADRPGNAFGSSPSPAAPARFLDYPQWDQAATYDYELAVVALEGPDTGQVYARIEWGFTADVDGSMPALRDLKVSDSVTSEFRDAAAGWNRQAAGSGGRQQPMPPVR